MTKKEQTQTEEFAQRRAAQADEKERAAAEERRRDEALRSHKKIWSRARHTLVSKFLETRSRVGGDKVAILDPEGDKITYDRMVLGAFALGNAIRKRTKRGENVGVLLPTSAGAIIGILALHVDGRVPAMLNFTAGHSAMISAIETAQMETIITSRRFVEIGGYEDMIAALSEHATILYMEDLREGLTAIDKLRGALGQKFPGLLRRPVSPDSPGIIFFTSGTEGKPKGVVLSHQNIVANVEQIRDHVKIEDTDIIFNPLPVFHSYGLTGGCLFALIDGKKLVPYPSPLHVKQIPLLVEKTGATLIFATDTFLYRYLRAAKPGTMGSLRYAICGAEKVRDETRNLARRLCGFNVIEGYGATEASPVVAVNQPGDIRPGTVGKMLPGIETRIEPVEGLSNGGRLFIKGPNIMMGYLDSTDPGKLIPPTEGWHDTGDIVEIDGGGYISIRGRLKRFAKIGGEMVSLAVVENCASVVWPEAVSAAVIMPDGKKGEQIILLTEEPDPQPDTLTGWMRSHGVPEIAMPKAVYQVPDIPLLGSGKVDFVTLNSMASELISAAQSEKQAAE